jgi:adenylate kinase family enzyme
LHAGKTVADQQVVDAIITITNRIAASGKGWILDGFPNTIDQANLLEKANFQPHFIFNITLPESVIVSRTTDDLNTA